MRAFDTRPVVREQVQSLGADFLMLDFEEDGSGAGGYAKVMSEAFINAEMALFREQASEIDIVITTALIPGKKAPLLWPAEMVALMKPGSVVVDLAAAQGGNCELTTPGEVVTHDGVTVIGYTDLTSRLPTTASELYATTVMHLLGELGDGTGHHIDHENLEVRGALVLEQGELRWPAPPPPSASVGHKGASEKEPSEQAESRQKNGASADVPLASEPTAPPTPSRPWVSICVGAALLGLWLWLKLGFRGEVDSFGPGSQVFLQHLTVFVLAVFVGWQVIWNVTAALHTPLMSVTNAISGIIIIGGMVQSSADLDAATTLGLVAVFFAMINVAGGFLVTQRMLSMFRR